MSWEITKIIKNGLKKIFKNEKLFGIWRVFLWENHTKYKDWTYSIGWFKP